MGPLYYYLYFNVYSKKGRRHLLPLNSSSYTMSALASVSRASLSPVVSMTSDFSSSIISPFGPSLSCGTGIFVIWWSSDGSSRFSILIDLVDDTVGDENLDTADATDDALLERRPLIEPAPPAEAADDDVLGRRDLTAGFFIGFVDGL